MGHCELSSEPACTSPRLFVADETEALVDNAVSEGLVERAMEPLACLDISSPASDVGEHDSVAQLHCCSDMGGGLGTPRVEDGNTMYDCPVPSVCVKNSESSIEKDDLLCADGPEELVCGALGERLQELVVVPCSGSNSSSQTPTVEKDMVLVSRSEEGFRNLESSSGNPDSKDGNVRNLCSSTAHTDSDNGLVIERHDVNLELGNAPSLECRLNRICLDERECESEIRLCCTNLTVDGQVPSEIEEVVVAPSGSVAQSMSDTIAGCGNPIGGSLVEVVCTETLNNGPSESLEMENTIKSSICVADPQFTCAVKSFDNACNTGNNNAGTDGDMCELKCPDTCLLPLRRSSRSRKSVQQVENGQNTTKFTKKTSRVSLHRTIDLLSEATRKKRSSLSRSICSAGWGVSENLSRYFKGSNMVNVNQVIDQRSRKKKEGQRSRKKNKLKEIASSESPEVRPEVPCRPIRLKVTFGKKEEPSKVDVMPPVVVDALPGLQPCNVDKSLNVCSYNESSDGDRMDISAPKGIPRLMQCSNSTHAHFTEANLEICSVSGKPNHDDSSQLDFQKQDQSCADKFSDPGTSPDSEVIDQVLDSTIGAKVVTSLHNFENKEPCGNASPKSNSLPASSKKSKNKRNKKDKLFQAGNPFLKCQLSTDCVEESKKGGQLQISNNGFCSIDNRNANSENLLSNSSGSEIVITELSPVADEGCHRDPSLVNGADDAYSRMISVIESADTGNSCQLLPSAEIQGKRNSKGSRTKEKSRTKSKENDDSESKITDATGPRKGKKKLTSKHRVRETSILGEACKIRGQSETGNHDVMDVGKTVSSSNEVALENASCLDLIPMGVGKQTLAPRVAWVCCDDCLKWRCIPAELADVIEETNCRWTCKDNQNQAFADCAIPQEKSNAEINAELQISDEDDARDGHLGTKSSGLRHSVASQPSTWMLIKSNLFLHRSRKDQTMDEIMVCHCKPPVNGSLGCGSQCLNRMLNIECVQGTCPCGDLCSNQQFQRRQYAMLSWFRCGKKGYGLQVLEDITEGRFLIEYVGEVLDLQSYEARQKDYASKGHKHFYFMTLNGNEVIDASAKGNLGRFVNHSCDPNCRTEKWVVNGEICVGLFALRNIKKGEELTFDYNYVRVFGAAAKKCHCGSRKCRGYIGGDPDNADVIVQGDSDEEFPEPIAVKENGEIDYSLGDMMAKSSSLDVERALNGDNLSEEKSEVVVEAGERVNKLDSPIDDDIKIETRPEKDIVDEVYESTDSSTGLRSDNLRNEPTSIIQNQTSNKEHTMSTATSSPKSDILLVENTIQKSVSDSIDSSGRVSKADIESELPNSRPRPRMKISRPSKSVKNRKSSDNSATVGKALVIAQRSKFVSHKPKKLLEGSANCHLEAVEEKLNELLDADGGICKKKDASKGYLKLLLLTFAQKDSGNGGAIQSNRDLSMILDAMLKTKSRGVLLDIINKNGLQMLHNMMKLYRRDFKKIPILRKLLKVLEFLAEKEILTVERINGDSLHPGVESLRESILFFTEHEDIQVHQIARHFRNRWIPHYLRKSNRMEKNDRRRDFRRGSSSHRYFGTSHHWREQGATVTERVTCSDQSGTLNNLASARMQEASSSQIIDSQTIASRPRRRKSRWDQPACPRSPKKMRTSPKVETSGGQTPAIEARETRDYSGAQNSDDDAPPGFSNPRDSVKNSPPGFALSSKCPSVSLGLLQERYNSRLPVAFGIPFSVVQQFGTLQSGTVDSWAIAPAMPFQPFPPLPPNPREQRPMGEREEAGNQRDQGMPSTSGSSLSTVATSPNMLHHERGNRHFLGKRYYRQKKWNNPKLRPPWLRNLDGWGFKGNYFPHPRNGTFDINMEMVTNDVNGQHLAGVNDSVEYAGNSC